jgi:hypothetical protein
MSLILDALKKSERVRHGESRSVIPLIVSPRRGQQKNLRKIPLIPLALVLLACALIVISYAVSRHDVETKTGNASIEKRPDIPAVVLKNSQRIEAPVTLARAIPVNQIKQEPAKPVVQQNRQQILEQAGIIPSTNVMVVPPRLSSFGIDYQRSVSPLHLDFHVYSTDRSRRVIFVNGGEYSEGEQVKRDLEVVRIVPEGAVMEWQGERFLLTTFD